MNYYSDQLLHPYWKIKRLQILERDNNECQICIIGEVLQIHHRRYFKDSLAWEYSNENLITLCRDCHQLFETNKKSKKQLFGNGQDRSKNINFFKQAFDLSLNENEQKIINYVARNVKYTGNTIKIDNEIVQIVRKHFDKAINNVIRVKILKKTTKDSIYILNRKYFGY
jgi:hypothetical protein